MADLLRVKLQAPLTGFPSIQTFNLIELKDTALACQSPEPAKLSQLLLFTATAAPLNSKLLEKTAFPAHQGQLSNAG